MSILIVLACIALLVLLITTFKINGFLAFLIISILAGLWLGIPPAQVSASIQKGIGDMLGSLVIIIVSGAMLGKLVAESGAAQRIAASLMYLFGERYIQWGLMLTGFVIGIPLFYNVGFVLVVPLIFSVVYRYNLSAVYIGLPMIAALSVTHGFLPPHPSPAALIVQFEADMGKTLLYGFALSVPVIILSGPLFSRLLRDLPAPLLKTFQPKDKEAGSLPSLGNAVFSSLLPVLLLGLTTLILPVVPENGILKSVFTFLSDPAMVMLISLGVATFTLGTGMGIRLRDVMETYAESVKDIALMLLIISGSGALKQILIESGVNQEIAALLDDFHVHPLILGWCIAGVIRICVGSATVAGLTAAGIMLPFVGRPEVNRELMVLSIGAGSLIFSHVNDAGFWLFKEFFNISIRDTIRSWSVMETIISISGLIGVMILNTFV